LNDILRVRPRNLSRQICSCLIKSKKVTVNLNICKAPLNIIAFSKALRYGHSQFYLQTCHTRLYSPEAEHHRLLAGTHFTITQTVEGWVDLGGWLLTEIKCRPRESNPDTVTHPSTNRAQRRLTSLIETNALPLRQTDTNSLALISLTDEQKSWTDPPFSFLLIHHIDNVSAVWLLWESCLSRPSFTLFRWNFKCSGIVYKDHV